MRISIYLLTTSHTHRFHPLSKIVIHTSVQYGCAEVWMTILESGWNLWVWLVGVVSRRWVWLVVRRYIDILTIIINFTYSTCISSFLAAASLLLCSFLKCFFVLVVYILRWLRYPIAFQHFLPARWKPNQIFFHDNN